MSTKNRLMSYLIEEQGMTYLRRAGRWGAPVAVAIVAAQLMISMPVSQAAAPPALEKVQATSPTNSVSPKTSIAACPAGKRVVGGGGFVFATAAADDAKVSLTRLKPVHSGNQDSYVVSGEEIVPGISGSWWVDAYALCAPAPAGYEITSGSTRPSSTSVQQTAAECPGSKEALGTGAQINNPGGQVTLQLSRSSGPRDISRVTAKEDASGYTGVWNVTTYAICANPLAGFDSYGDISDLTGPEDAKTASVTCPANTYLHSAGAATSGTPPGLNTTPPGVVVQKIFPSSNLRTVDVGAVETTPTNVSWDLVAWAICGP